MRRFDEFYARGLLPCGPTRVIYLQMSVTSPFATSFYVNTKANNCVSVGCLEVIPPNSPQNPRNLSVYAYDINALTPLASFAIASTTFNSSTYEQGGAQPDPSVAFSSWRPTNHGDNANILYGGRTAMSAAPCGIPDSWGLC